MPTVILSLRDGWKIERMRFDSRIRFKRFNLHGAQE